MLRITDVVKHLIIINVIVYIASTAMLGEIPGYVFQDLVNRPDGERFFEWQRDILAMFYPTSEYFKPFQIISHMFMHGGVMHLFFNMFGLFMFGPPLESLWGTKRFLLFYLITGLGALLIHLLSIYIEMNFLGGPGYLAHIPVVGASGALYGVLVGYGMNFPNAKLALIFFPVPIAAKYFIPGLLALDLLGGFTGFQIFGQSIAHFAHVGGAVFGFLMIMYWQKFGSRF